VSGSAGPSLTVGQPNNVNTFWTSETFNQA